MGKTISQFRRQLRMEKAADLLRAGILNVTQVAMEVGYAGLYPLATPAQRPARERT